MRRVNTYYKATIFISNTYENDMKLQSINVCLLSVSRPPVVAPVLQNAFVRLE